MERREVSVPWSIRLRMELSCRSHLYWLIRKSFSRSESFRSFAERHRIVADLLLFKEAGEIFASESIYRLMPLKLTDRTTWNDLFRSGEPWNVDESLTGPILREMKSFLGDRGIPLLIAVIPIREQTSEARFAEWLKQLEVAHEADRTRPGRLLADFCRHLEVPTLDLLPVFERRCPRQDCYEWGADMHWTPGGHRVVANALAKWIPRALSEPRTSDRLYQ